MKQQRNGPFSPRGEILSREIAYDGYYHLEQVVCRPDSLVPGKEAPPVQRGIYCLPRVAVVLLYMPTTDEFILNEQFRLGAYMCGDQNPYLLEACAGGIDEGEEPEHAARREAAEETGSEILDLAFVGYYYPSPGNVAEDTYIYIGRVEKYNPGVYGTDDEQIRTHLVKAEDAIRMLDDGKLSNAMTAIAVGWMARHRDKLRQEWSKAA